MKAYLVRAVGAAGDWLAWATRWVREREASLSLPRSPTDRADLLEAPQPGDACDAFGAPLPQGMGQHSDCLGDGHYLCEKCARLDRAGRRRWTGEEYDETTMDKE